jgi:aldehyde dehydrogenase (NAD+)
MLEYDTLFIGNRWVTPASEAVLEVRSPATLALVGRSPDGSPDDMDRAVLAARDAFDTGPWPAMSFAERAAYLDRILDALRPRAEELDQLVPRESGIPVCFSSGSSGFPLLEYFSELGRTHPQEELRPGRPGVAGGAIVRQAPAGVVAGIVPWNGPVMQILMKMAPALVAGCTLVIKPSPETPLSSYAIARAVDEADLPPGVVSVVPGGREAGSHLVSHPAVDRVSFTGSTAAGKQIAAACAPAVRRVSLELGGKSAAILLDDVDLDRAIPPVVNAGLFFNGEACSALTRVLVSRRRHDEVVDRLTHEVAELKIGDPLDPDIFFGPLVSERQRERVEHYVATGRDEGAVVVHGGGRPTGLDVGWYVEPTIFTNVKNSMRIAQDEVFGPVLVVIPFDDVDDAVRITNESELGLAGGVFADDDRQALDVARRLRTGHVGINGLGMDWVFPFGGFKQSGLGREMGIEGLELYCELQCIGLPEGSPLASCNQD